MVSRKQPMIKTAMLFILANAFSACGEEWNLNGMLFSPAKSERSIDALLAKAEYAYDQGRLDDARRYAERAHRMSPTSERASLQLGYIYLSLANIDSFKLAEALVIDDENTEDKVVEGEENVEPEGEKPKKRRDAASTIAELSPIFGIYEDQILKLGTMQTSELEVFAAYPLIYPSKASVARLESDVENLAYIDQAIRIICPFVDRAVLEDRELRHAADACPETPYPRFQRSKAHFLWAFSHLADAVAFNKLVLYTSEGESSSNLEMRANSISSDNPETYLSLLAELSENIDAIMDTSDPDSALNAMLNSISTSEKALSALAGLSLTVSAKLQKAIKSIREPEQKPFEAENPEAAVLKGQLSKKIAAGLAKKIDRMYEEDEGGFAAQKETICEAYASISQGQSQVPAACDEE